MLVQVGKRWKDPHDIRNSFLDREGTAFFPNTLDRSSPHVLHDDEALGTLLDEVIDAHDLRVLHRRQELPLRDCGRGRSLVLQIEQALHDDPARQHRVPPEIDPTQPTERDRALDLILAVDHVPGLELRLEVVFRAALRTKSFGAVELRMTLGAEPLALRDLWIRHDQLQRILTGLWRQGHQSTTQRSPARGRRKTQPTGMPSAPCARRSSGPGISAVR